MPPAKIHGHSPYTYYCWLDYELHFGITGALSVCNNSNRLVSTHLDESVRMWTLPSAKQVKASTERSVDLKPNYNQITQIAETEMFLLAGELYS